MKVNIELIGKKIKINFIDTFKIDKFRGSGTIFYCYETGYNFRSLDCVEVTLETIFIPGNLYGKEDHSFIFYVGDKHKAILAYKRICKAFENFTNYLKENH